MRGSSSMCDRLLKKTHMPIVLSIVEGCAQSPHVNVLKRTPPLVDVSRASPLNLFEQPVVRVSEQSACPWRLAK